MIKQTMKMMGAGFLMFCEMQTRGSKKVMLDAPRQGFKDAMLRTMAMENATLSGTMSVRENSETLFTGESRMERAGARVYSVKRASIKGKTLDMESAWADGSMLFHAGDDYNSFEPGGMFRWMMGRMCKRGRKMAGVGIDWFLEDVGGNFTEENGVATATLKEDDISAHWNEKATVLFSSMAEPAAMLALCPMGKYLDARDFDDFPIIGNARVLRASCTAKVEDGVVVQCSASITFAGKDKAGTERSMEMESTAVLSGVGATRPERIDTEGKTVTPLSKELIRRGWKFLTQIGQGHMSQSVRVDFPQSDGSP